MTKEQKITIPVFVLSILTILLVYVVGYKWMASGNGCQELDALFCSGIIGAIIIPFLLLSVTSGLFVLCSIIARILVRLGIGKNLEQSKFNSRWILIAFAGSFIVGLIISLRIVLIFVKL